jgi:hypothetical protein
MLAAKNAGMCAAKNAKGQEEIARQRLHIRVHFSSALGVLGALGGSLPTTGKEDFGQKKKTQLKKNIDGKFPAP